MRGMELSYISNSVMRRINQLLITLIFISLALCQPACPLAPSDQSQVISDDIHLISNSKNQLNSTISYNYTYGASLYKTPEIAVGINNFDAEPSAVMGIEITILKSTATSADFEIKLNENGNWKEMRVNFLSSTRSDLEFGLVQYVPKQNQQKSNFELAYQFKNKWGNAYLKIKPLLSSIHLSSVNHHSIGLALRQSEISANGVKFSFSTNHTIVHGLAINIIIFDAYNPSFRYSEGVVSQNYVYSRIMVEVLKQNINEIRTYIVGIISFNVSVNAPLSLFASINKLFYLELGPNNKNCEINHITISYLILSVYPGCGACEGYDYDFDGQCVKECPDGYYPKDGKCEKFACTKGYYWHDIEKMCTKCPPNSYIKECGNACPYGSLLVGEKCILICTGSMEIYHEGECQCMNGANRINGTCAMCPEGTRFDHTKSECKSICGANSHYSLKNRSCICNEGFHLINGYCQTCKPNEIYTERWRKCITPCDTNAYYNGTHCDCVIGFYWVNDQCSRCNSAEIYNAMTRSCRPKCGAFEEYNGKECVCQSGFVRINNRCQLQCGENQYFNGLSCECANSYYMVDGKCGRCAYDEVYVSMVMTCRKRCSPSEIFQNDECVCKQKDYHKVNGRCIPLCRRFESFDGVECVCDPGYHRIQGVCGKCANNEAYNMETQKCEIRCGKNEIYSHDVEKCICDVGYYMVNGQCGVCSGNQIYDAKKEVCLPNCGKNEVMVSGVCVCKEGHYLIRGVCGVCNGIQQYDPTNKVCVPICNVNEVLINGLCMCKTGYYLINGVCGVCPKNQIYDPATKKCVDQCKANEVLVNGKCQCKPEFYLINGACGTCGPNEIYDAAKKACVANCKENEVLTSGKCICAPGFYLVNGACGKCKVDETYDAILKTCKPKCAQNEVFVNGKCECKEGYYVLEGICGQCAQNQFYDVKKKICVVNCGENEEYDGDNCVCKAGFIMKDGVCCEIPKPRCLYNSFFDGTKCVCYKGFFEIYPGVCGVCPPLQTWNGKKCSYDKNCWPGYIWSDDSECCIKSTTVSPPPLSCLHIEFSYPKNGVCECILGYKKVGGKCVPEQPEFVNSFTNNFEDLGTISFVPGNTNDGSSSQFANEFTFVPSSPQIRSYTPSLSVGSDNGFVSGMAFDSSGQY